MFRVRTVVYVIVDRDFGERLSTLETGVSVWIVDTPTNRAVVQRVSNERPNDHFSDITTFKFVETASPEEIFLAKLKIIDLHHGPYSADPPYTVLQVSGASLSTRIKDELSAYGFNEFREMAAGFAASRPMPPA